MLLHIPINKTFKCFFFFHFSLLKMSIFSFLPCFPLPHVFLTRSLDFGSIRTNSLSAVWTTPIFSYFKFFNSGLKTYIYISIFVASVGAGRVVAVMMLVWRAAMSKYRCWSRQTRSSAEAQSSA